MASLHEDEGYDSDFSEDGIISFPKPKDIYLPSFLDSDDKWNQTVLSTDTMEKFIIFRDKIYNMNPGWSRGHKMDILQDFCEDLIVAHPFFNPFWSSVIQKFHFTD